MAKSKLIVAADCIDTDPDETNRLCIELLDDDPNNARAIFLMATVMLRAEKHGLAYNLLKRVTELAPKQGAAWNNMGMCLEAMLRYPEAKECFQKAIKLDPGVLDYQSNVAMIEMQEGRYKEAVRLSRAILAKHPEHSGANMTNGFSSLALHDWKPGWEGYEYTLGGKYRKETQYQQETRWDGSPVETLVVYGEQGIGDEIMYSSVIPSIKDVDKLIVECDHRLEGLIQRSFPAAHVYGTRRATVLGWLDKYSIDASCPFGGLPRHYRNSDADFPRKPFLVADDERRLQWRALFATMPKRPKIGIAWSGGRHNTGAKRREVGLEAFRELIETTDADFISLQYKDPTEEIKASGLPVKHYRRACQTEDYDDLAGMVAELDMVIGVHTAALHLSGGLGIKTVALIPSKCSWAYYGDEMMWYPDTYKIHRQKDGEKWPDTIKRVSWA